jgi:hypothetical protein
VGGVTAATFDRRATEISAGLPDALTPAFTAAKIGSSH